MSDEKLTRQEFRDGLKSAIRAVLNTYLDVKDLLTLLARAMSREPNAYVRLGGQSFHPESEGSPDAKILKPWMGALFVPDEEAEDDEAAGDDEEQSDEEVDDDADERPAKKQAVIIKERGSLLFAKSVIYSSESQDFEPTVLLGCLTDCRVSKLTAKDHQIVVPRAGLKGLLAAVGGEHVAVGRPVTTKVTVEKKCLEVPQGKKVRSHERRLVFTLATEPVRRALYEIDLAERIPELAADLKNLWIGPKD